MSSYRYVLDRRGTPSLPPDGRIRLLYAACANYSEEWNSTLHTHTCAEMFFITRGHGMFQVRRERFPVAINDLVVINIQGPHTEISQSDSPMEYVVLGVEGLETLTDLGGCALLHLLGEQEAVTTCLRQMAREIRERQPGRDEVCQKLLEIILLRLLRREDFALSSAPEGPRGSRECDLVRRYIDNHFKENLTLDQLAGMVHMSKYYLSHSFRKEFHLPHQLPHLPAHPGEPVPPAGDGPAPVPDCADSGLLLPELLLPELPAAGEHEPPGVPQAAARAAYRVNCTAQNSP